MYCAQVIPEYAEFTKAIPAYAVDIIVQKQTDAACEQERKPGIHELTFTHAKKLFCCKEQEQPFKALL